MINRLGRKKQKSPSSTMLKLFVGLALVIVAFTGYNFLNSGATQRTTVFRREPAQSQPISSQVMQQASAASQRLQNALAALRHGHLDSPAPDTNTRPSPQRPAPAQDAEVDALDEASPSYPVEALVPHDGQYKAKGWWKGDTLKFAVAITITKAFSDSQEFMDGLLTLTWSVRRLPSRYSAALVAIVHEHVPSKYDEAFASAGWQVKRFAFNIEDEKIEDEGFKGEAMRSG